MPVNHKIMFFRKGCKPMWEVNPFLFSNGKKEDAGYGYQTKKIKILYQIENGNPYCSDVLDSNLRVQKLLEQFFLKDRSILYFKFGLVIGIKV